LMTYASFFDDTTGILFCILGYFNYFWSYDILKLVMTYLFQVYSEYVLYHPLQLLKIPRH
jgi:hypothetical protein